MTTSAAISMTPGNVSRFVLLECDGGRCEYEMGTWYPCRRHMAEHTRHVESGAVCRCPACEANP